MAKSRWLLQLLSVVSLLLFTCAAASIQEPSVAEEVLANLVSDGSDEAEMQSLLNWAIGKHSPTFL